MAGISDYLAAKQLDALYGAVAYTPPSTSYLALFTSAPTPAGGGTEASSSGTGYARQSFSSSDWSATAGSTGAKTKTNANPKTFGGATGFTAAIGTVVGWATFDAATGGNMLHYGSIPVGNQKYYDISDTCTIAAGALTIQSS